MVTYLINREDRPARLRHATEELRKQNLNAKLFKAVIDKPGWRGCAASHLHLMEVCRNEVCFTLLEDDLLFLGDYHSAVEQAMKELPADWDMLLLGANPQEPFQKYSDHLYRMGKGFCTHAIIYHTRHNGAVEYILSNKNRINKIDVFYIEEVYPRFNCFIIAPMLISQIQFPSDTCKRSDVSQLVTNYNKYCL